MEITDWGKNVVIKICKEDLINDYWGTMKTIDEVLQDERDAYLAQKVDDALFDPEEF